MPSCSSFNASLLRRFLRLTTKILRHSYSTISTFQRMRHCNWAMTYVTVGPADYPDVHASASWIRSLNVRDIPLFPLLHTSLSEDVSLQWLCDVGHYWFCRVPQPARRCRSSRLVFLSLATTSFGHLSFVGRQGNGLQIPLLQLVGRQCTWA